MRTGVMLTALLLLAAPAHGFLLVGEDPAGDGYHAVLGTADVGDTVSDARTDVLGLDVAGDDEQVTLRLRFAEAPAGTGGYLYRVAFEAGGSLYWTCWTVQWVGGQFSEENVKGCSRFTEGTQVGPQVTGPTNLDGTGVFAASEPGVERGQVDGQEYVQWSVPRASIGGAGLGDLQNVFAETWFRGGSLDDAGSTVDSQYHWSRSDVGPDEGFWSIIAPAADAALNVTLEATGDLPLAPGEEGVLAFAVHATGAGNVTLTVEGVPANWTALPSVTNLTAPANTTVEVRVQVPADAPEGTVEMTLVARAGDQILASAPLAVQVMHAEGLHDDADDASGVDGNATDGPEVTADADTPGPSALAALVAVGVVAVLRRRR